MMIDDGMTASGKGRRALRRSLVVHDNGSGREPGRERGR